MSEQTLTTAERQELDVDEVQPDANVAPDEGVAIDLGAEAALAEDDSQTLATGARSGRPRRPRARPKATDTARSASDFDPSSRGDEGGEVM